MQVRPACQPVEYLDILEEFDTTGAFKHFRVLAG